MQNNEHLKSIILSDVEGELKLQRGTRKHRWCCDRIWYGPDPVEGDMLMGLNKERPKVWRVYTTRKKKEIVGKA